MTPEERLRQLLHAAVDHIDPDPDGAEDLRRRIAAGPELAAVDGGAGPGADAGADAGVGAGLWSHRAPSLVAVAAAFLCVVGIASALVMANGDSRDRESRVVSTPSPSTTESTVALPSVGTDTTSSPSPSSTTTTTTIRTTTTTITLGPPGTWRSIATAPGHATQGVVWTGEELVLWSGAGERGGVAYRPATNTWREFEHGPLDPRGGHTAIWTGKEIVYWGGMAGLSEPMLADGAAFDPARGTWRRIASAPMAGRVSHEAVWTGKEMVVWGGHESCCPIDSVIHDPAAAAYDPATDTWRRLADVPQPWSGDDGPATTMAYDGDVLVWREDRLGLLDMDANQWHDLGSAPPRGTGPRCMSTAGPPSLAALVGGRLFVWHGGCEAEFGDVYDLVSRTWRELAGPPPRMQHVVTAANVVVGIFDKNTVAVFDPAKGTWSAPTTPPGNIAWYTTATWTGAELLLWGGSDESGEAQRGGAAYRPA